MLASLTAHPVRFFEVLPRVPDLRPPGMFLAFCGVPAGALWLISGGLWSAIAALLLPLPISLALAGLYHLGALGGRFGYRVTWRVVAYPLGFYLPIWAVPGVRWAAALYAGIFLISIGLATVQEISAARAILVSSAVTGAVLAAGFLSGLLPA